jgi:hypothetical protein
MMSTKHAPLHYNVRSAPFERTDAPRELSLEEMDAVSGGTDVKELARVASQSVSGTKVQSPCAIQILLTCINIM